jgi:hypothetical protein
MGSSQGLPYEQVGTTWFCSAAQLHANGNAAAINQRILIPPTDTYCL